MREIWEALRAAPDPTFAAAVVGASRERSARRSTGVPGGEDDSARFSGRGHPFGSPGGFGGGRRRGGVGEFLGEQDAPERGHPPVGFSAPPESPASLANRRALLSTAEAAAASPVPADYSRTLDLAATAKRAVAAERARRNLVRVKSKVESKRREREAALKSAAEKTDEDPSRDARTRHRPAPGSRSLERRVSVAERSTRSSSARSAADRKPPSAASGASRGDSVASRETVEPRQSRRRNATRRGSASTNKYPRGRRRRRRRKRDGIFRLGWISRAGRRTRRRGAAVGGGTTRVAAKVSRRTERAGEGGVPRGEVEGGYRRLGFSGFSGADNSSGSSSALEVAVTRRWVRASVARAGGRRRRSDWSVV